MKITKKTDEIQFKLTHIINACGYYTQNPLSGDCNGGDYSETIENMGHFFVLKTRNIFQAFFDTSYNLLLCELKQGKMMVWGDSLLDEAKRLAEEINIWYKQRDLDKEFIDEIILMEHYLRRPYWDRLR